MHVTIVSNNPETLAELQGYFRDAGVVSTGTRDLAGVTLASAESTVVLFPDDFSLPDVHAAIDRLQQRRARLLTIIVTRDPRAFSRNGLTDAVILPKPAWGWTILDAIRAHVETLP